MADPDQMLRISDHFRELAAARGTAGPIGEVIGWLATPDRPLDGFEAVLERQGVRREIWFRQQIADLVVEYLSRLQLIGPISEEQLVEIELLKSALHVREGELLEYRPAEIATILNRAVDSALLDGTLDDREDTELSHLQIAFDLGYDDFLRLCRAALERGLQALHDASIDESDPTRVADLEVKMLNLAPLAILAKMQRRSPGALY